MHNKTPTTGSRALIKRLTIYTIMTISTLVLVALFVFLLVGYRYNKADGLFEQGGLVQFDSQPSGARVSIDGKTKSSTPSKATISSGKHAVKMTRAGYIDWNKSINVEAGELLWLNYTRLVPKDLVAKSVASHKTVSSSAASPDSKYYALLESPTIATLKLYAIDSNSSDAPEMTSVNLPDAVYTKSVDSAANSFVVDSWHPSSQYILMSHTYKLANQPENLKEWLLIDRDNPKKSKNISQLFGASLSDIEFASDNKNIVYGLVDGSVYRLDIDSETRSRPLVENVRTFTVYGDSLFFYVSQPNDGIAGTSVELGYYTKNADTPRVLRSVPAIDAALIASDTIAYGEYYRDDYVAISSGKSVDILKGTLPKSDDKSSSALKIFATIQTKQPVQSLLSMTNGRFFYIQTPGSYTMYDLELSKVSTTEYDQAINTKRPNEKLKWLDSYHLLTYTKPNDSTDPAAQMRLANRQLEMQEFDGANKTNLGMFVPTEAVTLSPSGKYLYGILQQSTNPSSSEPTYALSRLQLKL